MQRCRYTNVIMVDSIDNSLRYRKENSRHKVSVLVVVDIPNGNVGQQNELLQRR